MEFVVLGSGAAIPAPQRNLPGFALLRQGEIYLFDCGEGTQRQLMRFGVSYAKVSAIFISHLHLDHYLGLFGLLETLRLSERREPLTVCAPAGLKRLLPACPFLVFQEVNELFKFEHQEFTVTAFPVQHHPKLPSFGFVFEEKPRRRFYEEKAKSLGLKGPLFTEIQRKKSLVLNGRKVTLKEVTYLQPGKKIVYTGDVAAEANIARTAKKADLLIHDSTFASEEASLAREKGHSTCTEAAKIAKKAGVKKLLLVHISNRYRDGKQLEQQAKEIFPNTQVAEDGLKLEV